MPYAAWIRSALTRYRFIFHLCLSLYKFLRTVLYPLRRPHSLRWPRMPRRVTVCTKQTFYACWAQKVSIREPDSLWLLVYWFGHRLLEVERVGREHLFGPGRRGDDFLAIGVL